MDRALLGPETEVRRLRPPATAISAMFDQERGTSDVAETVSINTDAATISDIDRFCTPLSEPADDNESAIATPKAEKPNEANEYFGSPATIKSHSLKESEQVSAAAVTTTTAPPRSQASQEEKEEPGSLGKTSSSDATSEVKYDQNVALGLGPDLETATEEARKIEDAERDPDIVDWDGPDDPAKGTNWPNSKKWALVATLSSLTFVS